MNEAALYALEHIETTAEIHDAITDMEELVFKGFDSAVKEIYKRLVRGELAM